jgi:hypothetical protein
MITCGWCGGRITDALTMRAVCRLTLDPAWFLRVWVSCLERCVPAENIRGVREMDTQGRDRVTFTCPQCALTHQSLVMR